MRFLFSEIDILVLKLPHCYLFYICPIFGLFIFLFFKPLLYLLPFKKIKKVSLIFFKKHNFIYLTVHQGSPVYLSFAFLLNKSVSKLHFIFTQLTGYISVNYYDYFLPCRTACRILVSWLRTEPLPPALEPWSLNHWQVPLWFLMCIL